MKILKFVHCLIGLGPLFLFPVKAQQSLFNVPSITITSKKHIFVQEQTTFTGTSATFNLNTAVGLGKNWEVGLNVTGVNVGKNNQKFILLKNESTQNRQPLYPIVGFSLLKVVKITEHFKIGAGSQIGCTPTIAGERWNRISSFNYVNTCTTLPLHNINLYGGLYYGNQNAIGNNGQLGPMFGIEWPVIEKKLYFMADWIIGTHSAACIVPGIVYYPQEKIAVSIGALLPQPGTRNPYGLVFELTIP